MILSALIESQLVENFTMNNIDIHKFNKAFHIPASQ